jgi:hypothetical protein
MLTRPSVSCETLRSRESQRTHRRMRASLPPCNRRIKHREGLAKCSSDVLTVNIAEANLTPAREARNP